VFGQIKQARGFRQFLLRGVEKVRAEWAMICTAHNLLKLARAAGRRYPRSNNPPRGIWTGLLALGAQWLPQAIPVSAALRRIPRNVGVPINGLAATLKRRR
jgi:hypothetical protein